MGAIFECESRFFCKTTELFRFHEEPEGFDTLVGLDKNVQVIERPNSLQKGEKAILKVQILPYIFAEWIAVHTEYVPGKLFVDEQFKGPFRKFKHSHIFKEDGEHSILLDKIELDFFLWPASRYFIEPKLKKQFTDRHKATAQSLQVHSELLHCGYKNT